MQEQQVISAEMSIGDVVSKYPDTIHVFFRHGLGCVGCAVARFENIRQGAMAHGIDVDELMKDLNDTILVAQNN
jgi:hybrid cluster-associated redox disulfide protein